MWTFCFSWHGGLVEEMSCLYFWDSCQCHLPIRLVLELLLEVKLQSLRSNSLSKRQVVSKGGLKMEFNTNKHWNRHGKMKRTWQTSLYLWPIYDFTHTFILTHYMQTFSNVLLFKSVCVVYGVCVCVACRSRPNQITLRLELQLVVSRQPWVLGTKLGSSTH